MTNPFSMRTLTEEPIRSSLCDALRHYTYLAASTPFYRPISEYLQEGYIIKTRLMGRRKILTDRHPTYKGFLYQETRQIYLASTDPNKDDVILPYPEYRITSDAQGLSNIEKDIDIINIELRDRHNRTGIDGLEILANANIIANLSELKQDLVQKKRSNHDYQAKTRFYSYDCENGIVKAT